MIIYMFQCHFKPAFPLSSFTSIKKLFSSSLFSAVNMVSSGYLKLLIFLPAILILGCASSSSAFCLMYSAYKLNKQGNNIQSYHNIFFFLICSKSVLPYPVLTVASWPVCRFLRWQVRWSGIPIPLSILHSFCFFFLIHTVKGFGIVHKAKVNRILLSY